MNHKILYFRMNAKLFQNIIITKIITLKDFIHFFKINKSKNPFKLNLSYLYLFYKKIFFFFFINIYY